MTEKQAKAIERCNELIKESHSCWIGLSNQDAIKTVLSLVKEQNIEKNELISKFAKEMARLQKKADKYYYIDNNKEMADYVLIYAAELKGFASKLGICEEMYEEAYKIYDFKYSGKKGYVPSKEQLEELKKWYDVPTENF